MVIDFYTTRISSYCRAVKMLAIHLNLQLNEIHVKPFVDSKSEEFKKINPCHILPTINDNGFILWESRAIMQYLCNKYAPHSSLYPKDPQKRAVVERMLNFDLKTLSPAILSAHFEFMFPNEYSASRTEKLVALTDALTFLEIFLINKDYVAGDCLTIADISLLANVSQLEITVEFDLSSYPNIWGWFNRLRRELPYYDQLTKCSHDEHREHLKNIREGYEESACVCAFMPCDKLNGCSLNCSISFSSDDNQTDYSTNDTSMEFTSNESQNISYNDFLLKGFSNQFLNGFERDINLFDDPMAENFLMNVTSNGYLTNGSANEITTNGFTLEF